MPEFFERLNYSFGNEDWSTEQEALEIKADDTVLCITASGDRPFHLLLNECKQLISVDANPIQNHLLKLKLSAMRELDYSEYIAFLGAVQSPERSRSLQKIVHTMDDSAAQYWLKNEKAISKGIIYQGAIERLTKLVSTCFRMVRPFKLKHLFQINDLDEQREFLKKKWDTKFLRKAFDVILSPRWAKLIGDPGLYDHIDPSISVGTYIYNRMMNCLEHCLAKKNLLISLLFQGYVQEEGFPPYLTYAGSQQIKKQLHRISIKTSDVICYMESSAPESFDCFSLSDIASYMSYKHFVQMLNGIRHSAKPGARFCIRQFTSNHQIPPELTPFFKRNTYLENYLEAKDQCFVYRFMVGTIAK